MTLCAAYSTRKRCTGLTTILAKKRCRTSSSSASATRCSNRCGTGTTSTMWRSPRLKRWELKTAAFYAETGALRDMVANHRLQLLALTAMEPPVAFYADSGREQKGQAFGSIRPMTVDDGARFTVRGQYGSGMIDRKSVPGYRQEPGVNPNSTTETYAAVKFQIENWRWAGVPFYIRTGKRLARNLTEIRVHLK